MSIVYVILSTYNGERFLVQQLDSILNQQGVQLTLLVRDDGSSDGTLDILKLFARKHPNVHIDFGKNIGVIDSFFSLLDKVPPEAELIAFADQDDIWMPDKMRRAANHLTAITEPALYAACYNAIDENGQFLWRSQPPKRAATLANAIVQNTITGCTAVINRPLRQGLKTRQVDTSKLVMHDWWVYLTAACFGQVIYDAVPGIEYRQHRGNIVGVKNGLAFWLGRIKRFLQRDKNARIDQAQEFLRCHREKLNEPQLEILTTFINYRALSFVRRLCYALRIPLYMQKPIDTVILKLQVILNNA